MRNDQTLTLGIDAVPGHRTNDVFVAEPVIAAAPKLGRLDLERQSGHLRPPQQTVVKGGVKTGDLRQVRPPGRDDIDPGEVGGQMQRCERDQIAQSRKKVSSDFFRAIAIRSAMGDTVTNGDRQGRKAV